MLIDITPVDGVLYPGLHFRIKTTCKKDGVHVAGAAPFITLNIRKPDGTDEQGALVVQEDAVNEVYYVDYKLPDYGSFYAHFEYDGTSDGVSECTFKVERPRAKP